MGGGALDGGMTLGGGGIMENPVKLSNFYFLNLDPKLDFLDSSGLF